MVGRRGGGEQEVHCRHETQHNDTVSWMGRSASAAAVSAVTCDL